MANRRIDHRFADALSAEIYRNKMFGRYLSVGFNFSSTRARYEARNVKNDLARRERDSRRSESV